MRIEQLTRNFADAVASAQSLALEHEHTALDAIHVMRVLLDQDGGMARNLLQQAGVNVEALDNALKQAIDNAARFKNPEGEIQITPELNRIFNQTEIWLKNVMINIFPVNYLCWPL